MDYIDLAHGCDRARSHTWWKNLLEYGPWRGPNYTRVSPPTPEAITGIAKLFGTTEDQVAAMVAADWYGVHHDGLSARALRLNPAIDALTEEDAARVEDLIRRLAEAP